MCCTQKELDEMIQKVTFNVLVNSVENLETAGLLNYGNRFLRVD